MCTYLSYVFPRALPDHVREKFFALLQIKVRAVDAARFHPQNRKDETCWIRRDDCDCGTFVGANSMPDVYPDSEAEHDRARYRRKGWSNTKIERAIADRQARKAQSQLHHAVLARNWMYALNYLSTEAASPYLGVAWHDYSGHVDTEEFKLSSARADADNAIHALQSLPEDTLLRIQFSHTNLSLNS